MLVEALAAALVGAAALWLVLHPLLARTPPAPGAVEPLDPELTPKGVALTALKEIEFDRETGKLSDADYELLKNKYTAVALEALRVESATDAPDPIETLIAQRVRTLRSPGGTSGAGAPTCLSCGPRPEADATYCSSCGRHLPGSGACGSCGAPIPPQSRFCERCGHQVAA